MKKIILVFSVALFFVFAGFAKAELDQDGLDYLMNQGIVQGDGETGALRLSDNINRAELLKILIEGEDITPSIDDYSDCFPDVGSEWYAPYVCYAKAQGWVMGYTDGYFRPERNVSNAEALKMLLKVKIGDIEDGTDTWYLPYYDLATEKNIIDFNITQDMESFSTRGESFDWLFRLIVVEKENADAYSETVKETFFGNTDSSDDTSDNSDSDDTTDNSSSDKKLVFSGADLNSEDVLLSDEVNEMALWEGYVQAKNGDFKIMSMKLEADFSNDEFNNFSDLKFYFDNDNFYKGKISDNVVSFDFGEGVEIVSGDSMKITLTGDFNALSKAVASDSCVRFVLRSNQVELSGSSYDLSFSDLSGKEVCIDINEFPTETLQTVSDPDSFLALGGASDQFVASMKLAGLNEAVNIDSLSVKFDKLDTAGLYNGSDSDVASDLNAIKTVYLRYSDGTAVLTDSGSEATTSTISNNKALFDKLNLSLGRLENMDILVYVDLNRINDTDIARSGMAFDAYYSHDSGSCDITGATSGTSYVCSDIDGDSKGNGVYVFNNKVIATKSSEQEDKLLNTRREALKFNLSASEYGDAYFTGVKNVNIICSDMSGSGMKVTRAGIYQGTELLGALVGANLCDSTIYIDFAEKQIISSNGDDFTVKLDIENASTDDSIIVNLAVNSDTPGEDSVCWEDYGTDGEDGMEICWIDLGDSFVTTIENEIDY